MNHTASKQLKQILKRFLPSHKRASKSLYDPHHSALHLNIRLNTPLTNLTTTIAMDPPDLADAFIDSFLKSEMPKETKVFLGRRLQTPEVSPLRPDFDTLNY